jgi:hypothetical protein
MLSKASQDHNVKLRDLARHVIDTGEYRGESLVGKDVPVFLSHGVQHHAAVGPDHMEPEGAPSDFSGW